ncbi:MAG: LuxR C-terminal-related transcriptional regulator [Acidimicrobiia bacterium]
MAEPVTGEPLRVWIDDEHPIFRRGLASCVNAEGFALAGMSADLIPEPDPAAIDILIFEMRLGAFSRALGLTRGTPVRLLALVAEGDPLLYEAVDAGMASVLTRNDLTPDALTGALRAVAAGQCAVPLASVPALLERAAHSHAGATRGLSPRELSVLQLLSEGEDTRDIAESLGYAERTVKNIVHDLLVKMNCRNRVQAIAMATRRGLI